MTGKQIKPKAVQASSNYKACVAANLIGSKGLADIDKDGLLEHDIQARHMWLSDRGQTTSQIEIDLGSTYKVGFMQVWNLNSRTDTKRGVKKADISIWTESSGWKKIFDGFEFAEAEGSDDYDEPVLLNLGSVNAQKVRIDNIVNFGDPNFVGLSKVQIFEPRGSQAVRPVPQDGANIGKLRETKLTWVPGVNVTSYKINVGIDPCNLQLLGEVKDINTANIKLYELQKDGHYYWRVDGVLRDGSVNKGNTWQFLTGKATDASQMPELAIETISREGIDTSKSKNWIAVLVILFVVIVVVIVSRSRKAKA